MKIPEVRDNLSEIVMVLESMATELAGTAEDLAKLTKELYRRPTVRKAKVSSKPLTKSMANAIRKTAARHPHMSYEEIAHWHGINIGRVSEVLRGKRK